MWPPLFQVVLGLWLAPGWPAGLAALLLVGLATAWTTWRLRQIVRLLAGPTSALVAVAAFLTTPLVMEFSSVVMLDASSPPAD